MDICYNQHRGESVKIRVLFVLLFSFGFSVHALDNEKITVTLASCIDGDTAKFITSKGTESTRFLAIDTPEYTKEVEDWGKEASEFTCNKLMNAKEIILEFDKNSDLYDKYDRLLAWIWVDDVLLQDELIKAGLGEVAYLYGEYSYTSLLKDHQAVAEAEKLNIWSDTDGNLDKNPDDKEEQQIEPTKTNKQAKEDDIYSYIVLISFGLTVIVSNYYKKHNHRKAIFPRLNDIQNKNVRLMRVILYFAYVYLIVPVIYDLVIIIREKIRRNRI